MSAQHQTHRTADSGLPKVFGRYLLVQRLSRGGMGEIFLARHGLSGFEKLCVIKKVLPHLAEDDQFISRFIDEAQVAIKLQHANVAQVFEVGRVENEYFLAIEFVEGRDLRRTLSFLNERDDRLPPDLALFIGRDMASGLSYAHRRTDDSGQSLRLVHCDISPPNVMLSFEGEIKIIDFGIAKSAMRGTATDPKMGFGKFGYMAPEQLIRGGEVDYRTDIYAGGVILHELLTGERLYPMGETPDYRALARMVAKGQHPLPSHVDPTLKPYDHLVTKALRPDPDERYQSAAELRDAIQHALVGVNPTLSSDNLGSFMRTLFADEVAEQRRVAAKAEATDLEPWADLLTTQSATTVSYALAHMPLIAPPQTSLVARPLTAPPVARAKRRNRSALAAVLVLTAMLIGGTVLALVVGDDTANGDETAAGSAAGGATGADKVEPDRPGTTDPAIASGTSHRKNSAEDTPEIVVVPIEPDAPAGDPVAKNKPAGDHTAAAMDAKPKPRPKVRRPRPRPVKKPAPKPSISRKAVEKKFSITSREYKRYKKSFGERLAGEWADLATYVQFARSVDRLKQADRRLDRFRAKMRKSQQ